MADARSGEAEEQLILRLARVLADPLRLDILVECNLREVSPRGFRKAFGGPSVAKIQQAFVELEQYGWIERVPSAGGPPPHEFDRHYRSDEPLLIDNPIWSQLPKSVRSSVTARLVESIFKRAREAMKAGTMDARQDSHTSVTPLLLDRQGWERAIARVDGLLHYLLEERQAAATRLADSGEEPILMTVGLLAFESPRH